VSATGYTVDQRDIRFVLFEQLKVQNLEYEEYEDFDEETYTAFLEEAERVAAELMFPVNIAGDRQGCRLDGEGNVKTPDGYPELWSSLKESGWIGYASPADWGGIGLPHPVAMAVGEIFTGSCPALATYTGLSRGVANVLLHYGEDWMKETCIEALNIGVMGGTMCLTEAGAGSSVGDNRCKATPTDTDGTYHLEGEKIFITGGDQDLTENIVHLVLARLPGAPDGSKGLSIFLVPKYDLDDGSRNDAFVVGIEHKMGINGSATSTLALGANGPCKAFIIGTPGSGMRIMFHLMNEARVAVGIQGLSSAAAAYQNALYYARERVQGTSIKDFGNAQAQKVTINQHPDVRRMLMDMRVRVELLRSMCYTTALRLCQAENARDESALALVELMTPICKSYATDLGYQVCVDAIQVFGGYGYIQEYPVEQHARDSKIASIYEGTNGIQAMDLLGRKMRAQKGMVFMKWLAEANKDIARAKACDATAALAEQVEKAVGQLGATAMHLSRLAQADLESAMVQATPFLNLFGGVVLGVHALEQAVVAQEALDAGGDDPVYAGKVLNARYYVANHLPHAVSLATSIQAADTSCLDETLFN